MQMADHPPDQVSCSKLARRPNASGSTNDSPRQFNEWHMPAAPAADFIRRSIRHLRLLHPFSGTTVLNHNDANPRNFPLLRGGVRVQQDRAIWANAKSDLDCVGILISGVRMFPLGCEFQTQHQPSSDKSILETTGGYTSGHLHSKQDNRNADKLNNLNSNCGLEITNSRTPSGLRVDDFCDEATSPDCHWTFVTRLERRTHWNRGLSRPEHCAQCRTNSLHGGIVSTLS